jgi:uncharacterized Zn-finger protein
MADLEDLERRLRALEAHPAIRPGTQMVTLDNTTHHPKVGTWVADSNQAECKYCGNRIHQDPADSDTPGIWRYVRDPHCHAHAAGVPAEGE